MDENSDRLWKMRNVFEILSGKFSKFYSPSEDLAVEEVIVKYKGRVILQKYMPKQHKSFRIKIYKLCDENGNTYDMTVYLVRDRQRTAQQVTETHASLRIEKQNTRTWPQNVYGQLLLLLGIIR